MLKFVHSNPSNSSKRKSALRACQHCRERKKRCTHAENATTPLQPQSSATAIAEENVSSSRESIDESVDPTELDIPEVSFSVPIFVQDVAPAQRQDPGSSSTPNDPYSHDNGYTNPGHNANTSIKNSSSRFVGDLNPESVFHTYTANDEGYRATLSDSNVGIWLEEKFESIGSSSRSLFHYSSPAIQRILIPLLEEECLLLIPPKEDLEALSSIYFEKIHPLFPVIDETTYRSLQSHDVKNIVLQQALCMIASLDPSSKNHLSLPGNTNLSHREFGKRLFISIRTSVEIGLIADKLILIQLYSLLSFFMEDAEGRDLGSQHCVKAIDFAFSIGLHVQGPRNTALEKYKVRLLCCIWILDRIHAALHGRPVTIHDRDMRPDFVECWQEQDNALHAFLEITLLLDKVIDLYRPRADQAKLVWEGRYPSFEELLVKATALSVRVSLMATLEVFYHAVAILSCRIQDWTSDTCSSPSYLQQSLSATQITHLLSQDHRHQLSFLPFIPYAASLSLSVAYREMRHSKVPTSRTRARHNVRSNCDILDQLGQIFWSASIMADVGKSTLAELDKVISTMAESQEQQTTQASSQTNRAPTISNPSEEMISAHEGNCAQPLDLTLETELSAVLIRSQQSAQNDLQAQQPLLCNAVSQHDWFDYFSPSFDLDGVDAYFEGNLDLSFPATFHEY